MFSASARSRSLHGYAKMMHSQFVVCAVGQDGARTQRLQSKRILKATSQSPCLFITHPPTLCCFDPSLRGYLSDLDLKMAASLEWVGMRTGMRERNFSMPNQPRKKCFHHFGLGWFSFLCCRVLATHCVKKLTFTASIAPITYCDRSKRLKWSPPSYLLLVVNFKVPQV